MCNFSTYTGPSSSVPEIHWHVAWTLNKQPTNQNASPFPRPPRGLVVGVCLDIGTEKEGVRGRERESGDREREGGGGEREREGETDRQTDRQTDRV